MSADVSGSISLTLNMKKRIPKIPQREPGSVGTDQRPRKSRPRWFFGLPYALFFAAYCVVIALWAEPRVQFFGQPVAFYFDERFLKNFLLRPGGLVEYLACGLHQCYQFPWLGAAITTALAGLLALGSWLLLWKIGPGSVGTLCL